MSARVIVLGGGFGGLEAATVLSEALGEDAGVTLIERAEGFVVGFSKLELLFGRATLDQVRSPYGDFAKPGVRLLRESVTAIDPRARRVTTETAEHEADFLVVALGAELDVSATPGLAEGGHVFYSVEGALAAAADVAAFERGHAIVGVCGAPFKCAPAPGECALLLDDALRARGVRDACRITYAIPMPGPVPPSQEASLVMREEFAAREIDLVAGNGVAALDPDRRVAVLADGTELAYDLFLGVPRHRAPAVVAAAGLTQDDGFVAVDRDTFATRFEGVYAVGDVTSAAGVPKAGAFAQLAGRAVAERIVAQIRGGAPPDAFGARGACYVEFGGGRVGRVDVDVTQPAGSGTFTGPSAELAADKREFAASRRARWF